MAKRKKKAKKRGSKTVTMEIPVHVMVNTETKKVEVFVPEWDSICEPHRPTAKKRKEMETALRRVIAYTGSADHVVWVKVEFPVPEPQKALDVKGEIVS